MTRPEATRGLPDWLVIARREFLERVRSVWFLIITLLGPAGMVALVVVPALLAGSADAVRIRIVDHTGTLAAPLVSTLGELGWKAEAVPADTPDATLLHQIEVDRIDGFLTIPKEALTGPARVVYRGDNATNRMVGLLLDRAVRTEVQRARGVAAGLTRAQLDNLLTAVEVEPQHTTGKGEGSSGGATFLLGYIVMFVIYISIIIYAVNVMRSVVLEKTNRVVEIMAAAAKPRALMTGKILGVGGAGLLQLAVWLGIALLTIKYRMQLLGFFGASGGFTLPPLSIDAVAVILAYFLFGYFFYAGIYAALGAMVNSDQEAQQAQTPVVLLLIIPVTCVQVVANDPRGLAASVLTLIPFSSPVLMPMRYLLGGAGPVDVALSLGILIVSIFVVARLAARIYRVGILMYGKRPSFAELIRWLRH